MNKTSASNTQPVDGAKVRQSRTRRKHATCVHDPKERRRYQAKNARANAPDLSFQEFVRETATGLLRRRMRDVGLEDWKVVAIRRELDRRERAA